MTPETPTPETNAAVIDGYTFCQEDMRPAIAFCANLERERDAARAEIESMRAAIKEAHVFITRLKKQELEKDFDDYVSSYGVSQAFATSENACTEILTKLQPYLSDAPPPKP